MRTMTYTYNYQPELYEFVLKSNLLNHKKDEHKILKELVKGYSCKEIGDKLNYSERTIQNRRKDIYNKTKRYMDGIISDEEKETILQNKRFNVYLLTFPNNKVYIGITSQIETKRWVGGKGYVKNEKMFEDIVNFGWENIKKDILFKKLTFEEAISKEKELIIHYKSHLPKYGYNKEF